MSLTQSTIDQINQLANSAGALIHVTKSDKATNAILKQIEQLAEGPVKAEPKRAPIQDRIEAAKANSIRGLYGLFAELAKDQSTTIGELTTVAQELGYKNVGVITI